MISKLIINLFKSKQRLFEEKISSVLEISKLIAEDNLLQGTVLVVNKQAELMVFSTKVSNNLPVLLLSFNKYNTKYRVIGNPLVKPNVYLNKYKLLLTNYFGSIRYGETEVAVDLFKKEILLGKDAIGYVTSNDIK